MERIDQYLLRNHTNQTAKTYLYYIDIFLMQRPNASSLQYSDILTYINEQKAKAMNIGNLTTLLAGIKRYYDYLQVIGKRNDHPCRSIRLKRKKQPIQLQDLFTSAELEVLMNRENRFKNLDLRNKVMLSLMIYQALSCAELVRLELSDINLEHGTVYVKGSKKTTSRTLQLQPKQILMIQRYIDEPRKNLLKSETNLLLITQRGIGETVDGVNAMTNQLQALYPDRSLNPTTIRQSVISNLLNEFKKPLEDVQLFAGHRWPSATERYRRRDIDQQRKLINLYHPLK